MVSSVGLGLVCNGQLALVTLLSLKKWTVPCAAALVSLVGLLLCVVVTAWMTRGRNPGLPWWREGPGRRLCGTRQGVLALISSWLVGTRCMTLPRRALWCLL